MIQKQKLFRVYAKYDANLNSKLGSAEVAAWGLLGIIWEELDYVINAIAEGCVIRCAISLGAGRVHTAKYVAYKSLWICFIWGMAVTVILVVFANEIPALLTPRYVLCPFLL